MMTTFNCILILFFIIAQFYCCYAMIELISRQNDIISELSWDVANLKNEVELLQSQLSQNEVVSKWEEEKERTETFTLSV